jgi:hypothetical protein
MQISGSIRRTGVKPRRFLANRASRPLIALPDGTALGGPDAHHSGPRSFSPVRPPRTFCAVPKSVSPQRTLTSYFIPLERKSRLGPARSNFHEQGPAI